jgi:hypothetical protein
MMSFGILTLATQEDYKKAIGLALSVRVSNPGVPVAVACSPRVRELVSPFFDYVVEEDPSLRGFMHKLHLDRYSPFEETFFFDSDVFVFRSLGEIIEQWRPQPYTACGDYITSGISPFGLDRAKILRLIGYEKLVHIDGAGHAYFRKPQCHAVFDLAREVARDYHAYAGNIQFADEDVMDIVMTKLNLKPMSREGFWSRYLTAKPSSVKMDVSQGICTFLSADNGQREHPFMMHFAANEAPFVYTKQLSLLHQKFGLSTTGLINSAVKDYFVREIYWPLRWKAKSLLRYIR